MTVLNNEVVIMIILSRLHALLACTQAPTVVPEAFEVFFKVHIMTS
jgi:hypothetical protein